MRWCRTQSRRLGRIAYQRWFTKPLHGFWTCPVVPGTGPVGFEALVQELNPRASYASYDLLMPVADVYVVDTMDQWGALCSRYGQEPDRDARCPRWSAVRADWAAVHVTNRAVIESYATDNPLGDWGTEQTVWFSLPPGVQVRQLTTVESWADACARLRAASDHPGPR